MDAKSSKTKSATTAGTTAGELDGVRTSGRSETTKAAPARPLADRAAPNASPRTKKIAAQSSAALGKKELEAVVKEMGTAANLGLFLHAASTAP